METGQQLRIEHNTNPGSYIVREIHSSDDQLRLSNAGRETLGIHPGDEVTVSATVPIQSLEEAWRTGDIAEALWTQEDADIAVLAPHGGDIEYGTDDTASRIHKNTDQPTWTWMLQGWNPNAYRRFHISSNTLHPGSYTKLRQLVQRSPFSTAVSIHMQNKDYIAVGGQADEEIREQIGDRLKKALPGSKQVVTDHSQMEYTGAKDSNIINRISEQGIQLELKPVTAYRYRKRVTEAVISYLNDV